MSRKGDPLEGPRARRRVALLLVVSGVLSGAIVAFLGWPLASFLTKVDRGFCAAGGANVWACNLGWRRIYAIVGLDIVAVAEMAFLLVILVLAGRRWLFLIPPGLAILAGLVLARTAGLPDRPPLIFAQPYPVGVLHSLDFVIERYDPSWSWSVPVWMEHRVLWGAGLWFASLLPPTALAFVGLGRKAAGPDRAKVLRDVGVAAAAAVPYAGILLAASTLVGLPGHGWSGAGVDALSRWSPLALGVWCFSYGAVLGRARPWWPWLHVLVPFLTVPVLLRVVAHTDIVWPGVADTVPALAGVALYAPFVVIGASRESLAEKIHVARARARARHRQAVALR